MFSTLTLLLFLVSCTALIFSGWLVLKSILKISIFLRLGAFVTGFLILAVSTSLPELFIGINSAIDDNPMLSFGTVLGSNIADLTLVAGIAILAAGKIKIPRKHIRHDVIFMILISALPVVLSWVGDELSRIDAIILLIVFAAYWYHLIVKTRNHKFTQQVSRLEGILYTLLFIGSMAGLYLSAEYTVHYGTEFAANIGFPLILTGLFFLAVGTSLPELILETTAMFKGIPEIALGDLVGSVITNSTLVLGITALISPIKSGQILFMVAAGFMIVAGLIFAAFIDANNRLTKWEGIALILFYILFVLVEFTIKGAI